MTTWMLWHALKNPPRQHPVFARLTAESFSYTQNSLWLQSSLIQGQMWFWSLLFFLNMRLIVFLPLSATFYGVVWTLVVSSRISQEQECSTFDLLCVTPDGTPGTLWAIMTGCLHYNRNLSVAISQEAWSVRLVLLVPFVISLHLLFAPLFPLTGLTTPIWIGALVVLFYLDHIQSILLGSLVGLLASHFAPRRADNRLWALMIFLLIQVVSYAFPVVAIWLSATHLGQGAQWSLELVLPISVVGFYLLREVILTRLWQVMAGQVGKLPTEFTRFRSSQPSGDAGASYDDPQTVASA